MFSVDLSPTRTVGRLFLTSRPRGEADWATQSTCEGQQPPVYRDL
jgi:hypothetical protein